MLQNLKHLYGRKLGATDGDLGHVKDFLFDDLTWTIRYVVIDTGTWLAERQVLVSPHAFPSPLIGAPGGAYSPVKVTLNRKQVEASPSIDTHRPVSRQFEQDYFQYYGWPVYWSADAIWSGASGPLNVTPPPAEASKHHGHQQRDDIHLRSTKAVTGHRVMATDGPFGSVTGFMVDGKTWKVRELMVETGHWYAGKSILLLPENIIRVSYADSAVFVNLTSDDLRNTTRDDVAQAGTAVH